MFGLMSNTAIAAVSCESGDRWIITQNMTGSLRGLYSNLTDGNPSPWVVFTKDLNLTSTRPNTPISASCTVIPPNQESVDGTISAGLYVSEDTSALPVESTFMLLERTKHASLALDCILRSCQ